MIDPKRNIPYTLLQRDVKSQTGKGIAVNAVNTYVLKCRENSVVTNNNK